VSLSQVLLISRAKDFYALSGGKPNSQWEFLDKGVKSTAYNPNQHRSARNKAKSYSYRVKGLTSLFKEGMNVSNFRDDIMDHLEGHGMDTISISYLPELSSSLSATPVPMFSLIEHYPLFTSSLEKGLAVAKNYLDSKYDALDIENSAAAVDFLKNSLDPDLRRRLQTRVEPMDSFAMVWLRLMNMLVSHSSKHYDELRERVRRCTPRSFAEENLEKMCDFIRTTIEELEMAGQYQPSLTLAMLETVESDYTQKGSFNSFHPRLLLSLLIPLLVLVLGGKIQMLPLLHQRLSPTQVLSLVPLLIRLPILPLLRLLFPLWLLLQLLFILRIHLQFLLFLPPFPLHLLDTRLLGVLLVLVQGDSFLILALRERVIHPSKST